MNFYGNFKTNTKKVITLTKYSAKKGLAKQTARCTRDLYTPELVLPAMAALPPVRTGYKVRIQRNQRREESVFQPELNMGSGAQLQQ
jgi:hypothetical protein